MAILNNSNAISSGGYDINNSLRFRSSASAYLSRTPGSAGNRKTWTWSAWVKRGQLNTGNSNKPPHIIRTSSPETAIRFEEATDADKFRVYSLGTGGFSYTSSAVFRDTSAWYHIVVAVDTTQATASNRVKIYINGSQITAFSSSTNPDQNYEGGINNTTAHAIGAAPTPTEYFDGYIAEVHLIDGSQKAASDFGATDATTGVWQPAKYTGTYGTNGFYLKFSDIATTSGSNAGLGKDFSGNANYFTTNNISVTAGTTYDAMIDSPTLTSATVANYCVLNPTRGSIVVSGNTYVNFTLSNANLTFSGAAANNAAQDTSIAVNSGKYYWEVIHTSVDNQTLSAGTYVRTNASETSVGRVSGVAYLKSGNKLVNDVSTAYGSSWTTSDVIGIALDLVNNEITYYKNNVSQGAISITVTDLCCPHLLKTNGTGTLDGSINFGQRPFSYTPPTGFVRLNTYNLPDSTIKKGNTVMDATLWTGNGSTQSITGLNFQPDLVWLKSRSNAGLNNHLYDAVRGANKLIKSNLTDAEVTLTNGVNSFDSGGFSLGNDVGVNTNGATYVGWAWDANGAGSSNTSGNVTSTVSVNATAGFSVVTYTVTSTASMTIGHGLGVAPKIIIEKRRDSTANWDVYTESTGNTGRLQLNLTSAFQTQAGVWNNTSPTSTVFSQQGNGNWHPIGATCVAYCWAEIAGFSKFGSYTGNGSTDGPFVYTGFRPKFLLVKETTTGGTNWIISDSSRDTYNLVNDILIPNLSNAEDTAGAWADFVSNGFKIRYGSVLAYNQSGQNYIYMAFAENPFKNANAR